MGFEALLWASSAAACLMPVARLTASTGPHKVSTLTHFMSNRSSNSSELDSMELMVQVFYPTNCMPDESTYFDTDITNRIAKALKLPSILLHHVSLSRVSLCLGEKVHEQKSKYPVVIFSHGSGASWHLYVSLLRDLASHGYVVICPTHNDKTAILSLLPDVERIDRAPDSALSQSSCLDLRLKELHFLMDALRGDDEAIWQPSKGKSQFVRYLRCAAMCLRFFGRYTIKLEVC